VTGNNTAVRTIPFESVKLLVVKLILVQSTLVNAVATPSPVVRWANPPQITLQYW